jgi:hypothetical protein
MAFVQSWSLFRDSFLKIRFAGVQAINTGLTVFTSGSNVQLFTSSSRLQLFTSVEQVFQFDPIVKNDRWKAAWRKKNIMGCQKQNE